VDARRSLREPRGLSQIIGGHPGSRTAKPRTGIGRCDLRWQAVPGRGSRKTEITRFGPPGSCRQALAGSSSLKRARTRDLDVLELCDAVLSRPVTSTADITSTRGKPVTSTECEGCRREADSARQRGWRRKASGCPPGKRYYVGASRARCVKSAQDYAPPPVRCAESALTLGAWQSHGALMP
jgi:hypothetical protein